MNDATKKANAAGRNALKKAVQQASTPETDRTAEEIAAIDKSDAAHRRNVADMKKAARAK